MSLEFIYLALLAFLLLFIGFFLPLIRNKVIARCVAWLVAFITPFLTFIVTSRESALYRMMAIVFLQLLSMKAVVAIETYSGKNRLNFGQWCAFTLGWLGMRPDLFESLPSSPLPYIESLLRGISRIFIGIALLFLSLLLDQYGFTGFFMSGIILLIGLSLILHFGILNLTTALWRSLGVNVKEQFLFPYKAKSLTEFWGKRWNRAFSEMTSLIAYRPLKNSIGSQLAVSASFLLSGLLHEIAISFPVRSGYGLPLLYFAIHGILMYAEGKSLFVHKITTHKIFSHVWCMGCLTLPMPLLFHENFMTYVLKPLRDNVLVLLMPLILGHDSV